MSEGASGRERLQISTLSGEVRMATARLKGEMDRWTLGEYRDRPLDEAVAAPRDISRDPVALGVTLGVALHHAEADGHAEYQRAVQMCRMAGAGEDIAARMLDWLGTVGR
jgi:hypothetical protein